MFIDAFVSSVGPVYADYMTRSLPKWSASLDSITVVTAPGDPILPVAKAFKNVHVIETDLFKQFGAAFNKGAALNLAYAHMDPKDVVLHFDADIEPPDGWREKAEKEFVHGTIAGSLRRDEANKPIQDLGSWPYGYFQLWHSADVATLSWPLLEPWHPSAGGYDLEFLERWPQNKWKKLSFDVKHYGEVRQNWFGVGLPEAEQQEASRRMAEVHRVGLRETRLRTRTARNRLKIPEALLNFFLVVPRSRDWRGSENVCNVIRACMTDDPFLVTIDVSADRAARPRGSTILAAISDPKQVRSRVVSSYRMKHKRDPLVCPTGFDA